MMKTSTKAFILALESVFVASFLAPVAVLAATSPTLVAACSYTVLGHSTVTNTGPSTMPGDLGISTGGAPTGFPPGVVGPPGTIRNAGDSHLKCSNKFGSLMSSGLPSSILLASTSSKKSPTTSFERRKIISFSI